MGDLLLLSIKLVSFKSSSPKVIDFLESLRCLNISKNFTLRVDGGIARSIINEGDNEFLVLHSSLFVGGVEPKLGEEVLKKWHLRNATSFNGMTLFFTFSQSSPKMLIFVRLFERGLRQQQIS